MRLMIAFLAAAACIALGMGAANRLTARERLLRAWEGALQRLELALGQGGDTLPRLLRSAAGEDVPLLKELAKRLEGEPALSPQALLPRLNEGGLLTPAEQEVLEQAIGGLFSPTVSGQLQAIEYAREQWALFRRISREAWESHGRLYASLGWLAGAALFILMC